MHAPTPLVTQLGSTEAGPGDMLESAVGVQLAEYYRITSQFHRDNLL